MPSVRKKRAQNKQNYLRNKENRREASRTKYGENSDKERAGSQASNNTDKKRAADRASYWKNPDRKRAASRASYWKNPESKRASSRASSHTRYWEDPETKRASSHTRYWEDPEKGRAASRVFSSYWRNPGKKGAAVRITNLKAARAKLKWYRQYYEEHGKGICASRRSRYALAEPKGSVIEVHVKKLQNQLLGTARAKLELVGAFKKQSKSGSKQLPRSMVKTVCLIAAKRLCNKALQLYAKSMLGLCSRPQEQSKT